MDVERRTQNAERRTGGADARLRRWRRLSFCVLSSAFCVSIACSSDDAGPTTRPTSARERQDAALRDPFDYKPDFETRDVSGGGLHEFDNQGMKRDIDHVLNP